MKIIFALAIFFAIAISPNAAQRKFLMRAIVDDPSDSQPVEPIACTKPNEVYASCGSACPKTCDNKDKQIICTMQCVAGCFCTTGFIRDRNGDCINGTACPVSKCKKKNEIFNECGSKCNDANCDVINGLIARRCAPACEPGCYCATGFARDKTSQCIPIASCPKSNTCKQRNEAYYQCSNKCMENTCADPIGALKRCAKNCVPGCYCVQGYVRNIQNQCVLPSTCPK